MRITRLLAALTLIVACGKAHEPGAPASARPSILLVTLDTTRADAIGPEAKGIETPGYDALAKRGLRFRQAYTPVPQTLPAHTSILTGVYPAGHGLHENGRYLAPAQPLLQEKLHGAGYRTAAFVSAFALARRFGLARGFDVYDDATPAGLAERTAAETTDRVLAWLEAPPSSQPTGQPTFLWVHYYDPHYPYTPPEPYKARFAANPYLGEVAAMDEQLGRLVKAFEQKVHGPVAIIVVGDHGEGLGEHGEAQHGNLLYQATMHVPLVVVGAGVPAGVSDIPVSSRRIFDTVADFAGLGATNSLRAKPGEAVAGEAMKPFLDYGWQPQVMAIEGSRKAILAGKLEVYDVIADPGETHDLAGGSTGASPVDLSRSLRATLHDYPIPSPDAAAAPQNVSEEERRKLASLGYVAATSKPVIRKDAPRPADMAALFPLLDDAALLFVHERYAEAIPLLERILAKDPFNLDAALRLATAHSSLGHEEEATRAFRVAEGIAPESEDVRTYLALHLARGKRWREAIPLLERIVTEDPERLPPLEALAVVREREGRIEEAVELRQRIYTKRSPSAAELVGLAERAMSIGQTPVALDAFEKARRLQGTAFDRNLELGVLYLAERRFEEARTALDLVPPSHPGYPMALFKRAQVSVLLHEPDASTRIETARAHANAETRELIARERLFQH
jgi:arylsulfatase A-like enzyme/tetratricopeptide (TPR) repeat protein